MDGYLRLEMHIREAVCWRDERWRTPAERKLPSRWFVGRSGLYGQAQEDKEGNKEDASEQDVPSYSHLQNLRILE